MSDRPVADQRVLAPDLARGVMLLLLVDSLAYPLFAVPLGYGLACVADRVRDATGQPDIRKALKRSASIGRIGWGLQFETIEKRIALQACWDRISDRPAYRRANELDDALMPAS